MLARAMATNDPGPPAEPAPVPEPEELFARVGGEAGVRRLVDRFYDLMDGLPEARRIRSLHPASLDGSRDKLHWFLVGWLGGPPLYVQRFGHPRLRARHLPFPIGRAERDAWLLCMRRALVESVADEPARAFIDQALSRLADHMRNQPEPDTETGGSPRRLRLTE